VKYSFKSHVFGEETMIFF